MGFIAPPPPDELLKLLKGLPGQSPLGIPGGTPGIAMPPGGASAAVSGGMPATAMGAIRQPQPAPAVQPAPAPTDDPSVSSMGTVPHVPDFGEFIRQGMARRQAAESKQAALHVPTPAENKPSIWRRLASIPIGAAARFANPETGGVEQSNFLNAKFNRAKAQYAAEDAPIQQELQHSKEDFPLYTAAGEAAHRQFTGQLDVAKENRERFTAKSNSDYKGELNQIRQMYDQGRLDDTKAAIDARLKELDEKSENNKAMQDYRSQLLDLKQQAIDNKRDKDERGKDKSAQFRTVASQKASAITKANAKYDKAVGELSPKDVAGHKEAQEEHMRDLQEAQDAYEEGITTLGGSAEHQEVTASGWKKSGMQPEQETQPAGKPQPQQEVKSLNGHAVGQVVKLKDGSSVKITKMYADGRFEHEPAK